MATSFQAADYDVIREGCRRSAEAVVPVVLSHYPAESVIDVGGGEGWWAQAFRDAGCSAVVFDGPDADPDVVADLTEPLPSATADLAVCLEVAEHLPKSRAESFITDLCSLAPVVLFSAAIPGQGGQGHINEQWPAYWVERFEANGYRVSGQLRYEIWNDERIENWYRQNLLVASRVDLDLDWEVLPLVHPILFDARRR